MKAVFWITASAVLDMVLAMNLPVDESSRAFALAVGLMILIAVLGLGLAFNQPADRREGHVRKYVEDGRESVICAYKDKR